MANSDKDILITPNTGQSAKPKIEVTGADNATKTITINDDGTLSFDSTIAATTGSVADGNANLVTGDAVFDYIAAQNFVTSGASNFVVGDITGQTALTSGLASTDELVLSDAGVLKRMDVSVLQSYMQSNLTFTTDTILTTENVQDIVGAMVDGGTETNIAVTYDDTGGKLNFVSTDTNTQLTTEQVQDIVGAMFTSNTETRISATYEDGDGTIDLVVDDMTADTNTFRTVTAGGNTLGGSETLAFTAGSNVTITESGGAVTIASTDTNTQLTLLDEDNMSSNSATAAASQQSIKAYVDSEVAGIVDSAPSALNTLNELAAALGDDASFSTTTATSLGNRLRVDVSNQGLNSTQQGNALTNLGITATLAEINILDDGLAASDIPNLAASKITSGTLGTARIPSLATSKITSGTFADARIAESNVTQHLAAGTGLSLSGKTFSANLSASDIPNLAASKITSGTFATARIADDAITEAKLSTTNTAVDNYLLSFDSASGGFTWVAAGAGGENNQNAFSNVAVSGQTTVAADSTTDTLNLAEGSNVTITTNASNDTVTIAATDTNTQLSTEQVQDIVGAMFGGNTETRISATYQDGDGTIDLVVDDMTADTNTQLSDEQVQDIVGAMFSSNTETRITATYQDGDGTVDLVVDNDLSNYDNSSSGFITSTLTTEQVQDIVGAMFSGNTETRVSATYQDGDGTIDLVVDDMTTDTNTNQLTTFTLTGDSGSNQTIAHGNTLDIAGGDGIATVVGSTDTVTVGLDIDGMTDIGAALADADLMIVDDGAGGTNRKATMSRLKTYMQNGLTFTTDTNLSTENVQDIIGAMVSGNTETNIAVTYDDTNGKLNFASTDTNTQLTLLDQDDMSSNSATAAASQQSIKAYVDAEVAGLVASAPSALNTLNELAAALGDDADFSTTTATSLGNRLRVDVSNQGLTSTQQGNALTNLGITASLAEINILDDGLAASDIPNLATSKITSGTFADARIAQSNVTQHLAVGSGGGIGLSGKTFSLDIDGMTDINAALVDADLMIVDDGAGGTNRKATMSRLKTYMQNNLTFTTNTNTQLSNENVMDIAGPLVATGGTKTRIAVTYDDANNNMDFVVDDMNFSVSDITGATSLTSGLASTDEFVISDAGVLKRMDVSVLQSYMQSNLTFTTNTNTQLSTEQVQDIVGGMFSGNTETNITATYQDGDGTIDLVGSQMTFILEDDDGTEVSISNAEEIKFHSGDTSVDINYSDISPGSDADPFDLDFRTIHAPYLKTQDDRDFAPEDLNNEIRELSGKFSTKTGLEDGSTTNASDYVDVLVLDTFTGHSGGDANILAFAKNSTKRIYHYRADQDDTNWGTASTVAYTSDVPTTEAIQDIVGGMFSSNTETGITATYQDGDGTIDLVVGTLNQNTTGNAATVTVALDESTSANNTIPFLRSDGTLAKDGGFRFNPGSDAMTVPKISASGAVTVGTLEIGGGGVTATTILDEDNMASDSATALASQQSIKAYVDANAGGGGGIASVAADSTPQLGGDLDVNGNKITSASNADVTIEPNGTGDINLYTDKVVVGDASTNFEIQHRTTTNSLLRFQAGGNTQLISDANIYINADEAGNGGSLIRLNAITSTLGKHNNNAILTTSGTGDLTLSTNSGTNSGTIKIADGANGDITIAPNGTGALALTGKQTITVDDTVSEAFKVTITDTDSDDDSTPFVIDGDGRVGIGTDSPVNEKALTLNGDGSAYEGIAFQVNGSTKFQQSTDGSSFYFDSEINTGNMNFRVKDSSGNKRPVLGLEGDGFRTAIGYNGTSGSSLTPNNTLQVNVGTDSGVQDKDDGILLLNSDLSIADGDKIGGIGFATRDGNIPSVTTEAAAAIVAYAAEDHGTGDKGGDLAFLTSPIDQDDDTASSERMRIDSEGHIGIGTATPSFTSGSGIEVSHATQANFRATDSNGASTDFATSGNDTYILNRHASGKIYIKPGNGDHSIELASNGQVKFNNAYTFPTSDGSANQVLVTNGSGTLSFANQSGGGSSTTGSFYLIAEESNWQLNQGVSSGYHWSFGNGSDIGDAPSSNSNNEGIALPVDCTLKFMHLNCANDGNETAGNSATVQIYKTTNAGNATRSAVANTSITATVATNGHGISATGDYDVDFDKGDIILFRTTTANQSGIYLGRGTVSAYFVER